MAMTMKEFLQLYFRQLHFNAMPDAVRSQFDDYVAANSFRGDMKSWRDDLLKKDASGNPYRDPHNKKTGHYVANDLPDVSSMDDDGWKQLYNALWRAFDKMDARRDSLDKATVKFLDNFFGDHKTFKPIELDDATRQSVRVFFDKILNTTTQEEYDEMFSLFKRYTGDEDDIETADFDKFKTAIQDGSYERKPDVRQKLRKFVENLKYQYSNNYGFYEGDEDDAVAKKIRSAMPALNAIESGFAKKKDPTTDDIDKLKGDVEKILTTLHKEEKVANDFKNYDKGKISGPLEEAIKKTDYTGKITEKDFVPEKYQDKKNVFQRASEKVDEFYDNWLKKYVTAHRDHIYKIPTAKAISEAIIAAKVKPTDGIAGILAKKDDVIKKLQNKTPLESLDQFKWFISKIEQFQNGKMKEAVEGALREGPKMNKLVEALALDAIEETQNGKNRIEDAKAAMEMLTVMQYGTFTSRRLDALRGEEVKMFSDKDLSWNKNEGINTVMKGLDKTIKFAAVVAGAGITAAANRIRRIGVKFKHSGELEQRSQDWKKQNQLDKDAAEAAKDAQKQADEAQIDDLKQKLQDIEWNYGIYDDASKQAAETSLNNDSATEQQKLQAKEATEEDFEKEQAKVDKIKKDYAKKQELLQDKQDLENTKNQLAAELSAMSGSESNPLQQAEIELKKIAYKKAMFDLQKTEKSIAALDKEYSGVVGGLDGEYARINAVDPATGKTVLEQKQKIAEDANDEYEAQKQKNDKLAEAITTYTSAKADIEMYEAAIKKRDEDFDKWDDEHHDYYAELMGFWDFMQTGKTKSLFNLGRKRIQKRYDRIRSDGKSKMTKVYEKWIHRHGYDM